MPNQDEDVSDSVAKVRKLITWCCYFEPGCTNKSDKFVLRDLEEPNEADSVQAEIPVLCLVLMELETFKTAFRKHLEQDEAFS